jgi:hypothetical protein
MLNFNLKKTSIIKLTILLLLFMFIYTPRLNLDLSITHGIGIISFFYLYAKKKLFSKIINLPLLKIFIIFLILLNLNTLILGVASNEYSNLYWAAQTLLEVIPISIFIVVVCLLLGYNHIDFYNLILATGMLQVILIVIAVIFPEARDWMIQNAMTSSFDEVFDKIKLFRAYGFSSNLTFSMPLFLGLCSIIAYAMGVYISSRYFLLVPFYIFGIAINARIGLIGIFIIAILVLTIKYKSKPYILMSYVVIFYSLIKLAIVFIEYMAVQSVDVGFWIWFLSGINEYDSFSRGETDNNLYILTTYLIAPNNLNLFFGTGEDVFNRELNRSDIGYVVNLYYGGLFTSFILYFPYIYLLLKIDRGFSLHRAINYSILLYILIANIKGNLFMPNELMKGVILLLVFSIVNSAFVKKLATRSEVSVNV